MIICIKNWDGISQAPALFLRDRSLVAIVRGYISISGHHKGLASPLPHPEGHTQDECDALPVQIIQLCHTCHLLTLALASTWAPFCTRCRTTSVWPALDAMCSAVSPLCRQHHKQNRIKNTLQEECKPACFINTEIPATQLTMISTRKPCCSCR